MRDMSAGKRPSRSARWLAITYPPAAITARPSTATLCWRVCRCGRKLTLRYSGAKHDIPRYSCSRGWMDNGEPRCIAFGGLRVDHAIEEALLTVVEPGAFAASIAAGRGANQRRDQVRGALKRDLEAARLAADLGFRQYA